MVSNRHNYLNNADSSDRPTDSVSVIRASGYFDSAWYSARYLHLVDDKIDAAVHFYLYGANDGLSPGPFFDTIWYKTKMMGNSSDKINPLVHYVVSDLGRSPMAAPILFAKSKVHTSDYPEIKPICAYMASNAPLPKAATGMSNYYQAQIGWFDYYMQKASASFASNELSDSLAFCKAAIKCSPYELTPHLLFNEVFSALNHETLGSLEGVFCNTRIIYVHISCKERIQLALDSANSFPDQEGYCSNLVVIGDPEANQYVYRFDPNQRILTVPAPDSYEALPLKTTALVLLLGNSRIASTVLKLDDDIHCASPTQLYTDYKNIVSTCDYGGGRLIRSGPFSSSSIWHMGKCTCPMRSSSPGGLPTVASYINGPYYWLSSDAINLLSKAALIYDEYITSENYGYEDRCVGTILNQFRVTPVVHDMIKIGSLAALP